MGARKLAQRGQGNRPLHSLLLYVISVPFFKDCKLYLYNFVFLYSIMIFVCVFMYSLSPIISIPCYVDHGECTKPGSDIMNKWEQ